MVYCTHVPGVFAQLRCKALQDRNNISLSCNIRFVNNTKLSPANDLRSLEHRGGRQAPTVVCARHHYSSIDIGPKIWLVCVCVCVCAPIRVQARSVALGQTTRTAVGGMGSSADCPFPVSLFIYQSILLIFPDIFLFYAPFPWVCPSGLQPYIYYPHKLHTFTAGSAVTGGLSMHILEYKRTDRWINKQIFPLS